MYLQQLAVGLLVVFGCVEDIAGVIIWSSKVPKGMIELDKSKLKNSERYGVGVDEYEPLVKSLANYSIDEKCSAGHDFGIGFQMTSPYVIVGAGSTNASYGISGVFPNIVSEMMDYCCPKSKITYGHHFKSAIDIEEHYSEESELDLTFPLYGLNGKDTVQFKDFPFIPIVTAPRVVLLVPDRILKELDNRTEVLLKTIFNTWPMLCFIVASAMLSGLVVWLLDRKKNAKEFPPTFFNGAWEGIWWAFVTMTTVGYGDRSPKSTYARGFCILWILFGIMIISLFTGLISAALNVSVTPPFKVAGSKIGAVRGSLEYQLAIELNAEVIGFDHHLEMLSNLTQTNTLHGAMLDNFILSRNPRMLSRTRLRSQMEFDFPVTYGIVMKRDSPKTEECLRRYTRRHPNKIFEIIAKQLKPIKNPTDEKRFEAEAAETFYFHNEPTFKLIIYIELGLLLVAFILGAIWEFFIRNKNSSAYRFMDKLRKKPKFVQRSDYELNTTLCNKRMTNGLDSLIEEYSDFHTKWVEKVRQISSQQEGNGMDKIDG